MPRAAVLHAERERKQAVESARMFRHEAVGALGEKLLSLDRAMDFLDAGQQLGFLVVFGDATARLEAMIATLSILRPTAMGKAEPVLNGN